MDFNATIDLIIKDLEEARKIIDDLKKYPGVPVLQVELAKSKCKSAGEVISLLKEMDFPESSVTEKKLPVQETKPVYREEEIIEISITPEEAVTDQNLQADNKIEPGELQSEKNVIPEKHKDNETPGSAVIETSKGKPAKKTDSAIMADRFSHLSNRFNEQLGGHNADDSRTGILKSKHVTNLSEAIGINDRFLFIREIFDGNLNHYSEAITKLNNVNNLSEARDIISSYTDDNNDNEAVKQLLDLVKRKLPSHE